MVREGVDIDEILNFTDGKLLKKISKREQATVRNVGRNYVIDVCKRRSRSKDV